MAKKIIALLLAAVVSTTMFVGCKQSGKVDEKETTQKESTGEQTQGAEKEDPFKDGNVSKVGYPIAKEKVKLSMFVETLPAEKKPWAERDLVKEAEAKTNVEIEWIEAPSAQVAEKINLYFASDDMPDVFYNSLVPNLSQKIVANQIVNLTPYLKEYAPNFNKLSEAYPEIRKRITFDDGNIYSYAKYDTGFTEVQEAMDGLYINKMWLEKLNLEVPKTTEDYFNVLKAFSEQDPNGNSKKDEVPFSVFYNSNGGDMRSMFGSFGVLGQVVFDSINGALNVKDGKVVFAPAEEGYFKALQYFNRLYNEGLLDKESFTQNNSQLIAKGKHEDYILGSFIGWNQDTIVGFERAKDYVLVPGLLGPNGDRMWTRADWAPYPRYFVTSNCKNIEAAVRWIDMWSEEGNVLNSCFGPEGLTWEKVGDDSFRLKTDNLPEGVGFGELRQSNNLSNMIPQICTPLNQPLKGISDERTLSKKSDTETLREIMPKEIFAYLQKLPSPDDQKNALLENDVINYIKTFVTKAMIDGVTDEQWAQHLDKLKALKIDEVLKVKQEMYDKYLSAK